MPAHAVRITTTASREGDGLRNAVRAHARRDASLRSLDPSSVHRRIGTMSTNTSAARDAAAEPIGASPMRVRKRNGSFEPVDVNKIVRAVGRCAHGLSGVDPLRVATRTISGLYDGATTRELDQLSIQTAATLIVEEPAYSRLAA